MNGGRKFPYEDSYKLQKREPLVTKDLILDLYFSFIAGCSDSAARMETRPASELASALHRFKKSFLDMFPQYLPLADLITADETPTLFHRMR